jgi:hypothetical protein
MYKTKVGKKANFLKGGSESSENRDSGDKEPGKRGGKLRIGQQNEVWNRRKRN